MLATIGILLITAIIILVEVPHMKKKKQKRDLWVFSLLLLCGFCLGIAEAFELTIPNPLDWISFVYKPVSDIIYGALN